MKTNNMSLLTDLPAGLVEPDRFQHEVYSRLLAKIFTSNRSGICVGLLGKWGHGKSTIVNLLTKNLEPEAEMIVFNAWKARGDSVRRQMLLTIMEKICPDEEVREFKKFADIYVVQSVIERAIDRKAAEKKALATIRHDLFHDLWLAIPLWAAIVFILLSMGSVIGAFLADAENKDCFLALGSTFFLPAFTAMIVYILGKVRERYSVLVGNIDQISESQKIRYPDQFKEIFAEKVNRFLAAGKKNKLIIVVDDLDRCDPGTVIEALAAIRQFSDPQVLAQTTAESGKTCQFLVPCDEQQVILALESDGYRLREDGNRYHDYQRDELLRKFFDIVVRMDPVPFSDLAGYAADLAGQIGIDAGEARELIDLVAASNPRQVKQLLNAYKVAGEKIHQIQTAPECMLPSDELMPQKTRTLMALVALRETTPVVYDWITQDISRIADIRKDDFKMPGVSDRIAGIARGILTRSGDISPVTAEYLIAGRYEKVLQGCAQAGQLVAAIKTDNKENFAASLRLAAPEESARLIRWLHEYVSRCPTASRLTGYLSLFIPYAVSGHSEKEYILPVIETCAVRCRFITNALANFKYYDELKQLLPEMRTAARLIIINSLIDNFFSDIAAHNDELKLLLSCYQLLTQEQRRRLEQWIEEGVGAPSTSKVEEFVSRLDSVLPVDAHTCWGMAPSAGITLASKPWPEEKPLAGLTAGSKKTRLIPIVLGDNAEAGEKAIKYLFDHSGPLSKPTIVSEASPGIGLALQAAEEILKIVRRGFIVEVYHYYEAWLSQQQEPYGVRAVLNALKARVLELDKSQIEKVGKTIAAQLWRRPAEYTLCDYTGSQPIDRTLVERWEQLCISIFNDYASNLKSQNALNEPHCAILIRMTELKWPVNDIADDLLSAKAQQLPSGTQDAEKWAHTLKPLMSSSITKTKEIVLQEISQRRQHVQDALRIGLVALWTTELDDIAATTIANWCYENENQMQGMRESLGRIAALKGGERVIEILVDLLNEDRKWLMKNPKILDFVATGIKTIGKAAQLQFQRKIKQLILSDQEQVVLAGIALLKGVTVLDESVKAEVERLPKKFPGKNVKELCAMILSKA